MNSSISVIVTVYNRFELTKRAVESVLGQTLPVSEGHPPGRWFV